MSDKFLKKTSFINFYKRLTTSELRQSLSFSKQNGEPSQSIQKMSNFWQQFGWSDYYQQLQTKVERFADDVERGFQVIGRKMSSTGNCSIRQAWQNVQQMTIDSKQRLAKDIILMRDILSSRVVSKGQTVDSMSIMEEGKLEKSNEAGNVSANVSEAEQTHESCNGENKPNSIGATYANVYRSTTQRLDEHEIFPSDSSVVNARISISTTEGVFSRATLSSGAKSN